MTVRLNPRSHCSRDTNCQCDPQLRPTGEEFPGRSAARRIDGVSSTQFRVDVYGLGAPYTRWIAPVKHELGQDSTHDCLAGRCVWIRSREPGINRGDHGGIFQILVEVDEEGVSLNKICNDGQVRLGFEVLKRVLLGWVGKRQGEQGEGGDDDRVEKHDDYGDDGADDMCSG